MIIWVVACISRGNKSTTIAGIYSTFEKAQEIVSKLANSDTLVWVEGFILDAV